MSRVTELIPTIKPYILRWMQEYAVGGAPSPHALNSVHHSGELADSQATQFLKTDGTRTLTGNLAVSDLVTIDGVDLSVHAANTDAHHNRQHGIVSSSDHSVTGSQWDVIGLTGTNTLGILTPSANVGGAGTEALLKSNASGNLTLHELTINQAASGQSKLTFSNQYYTATVGFDGSGNLAFTPGANRDMYFNCSSNGGFYFYTSTPTLLISFKDDFTVNVLGDMYLYSTLHPAADQSGKIGDSAERFADIYTIDLYAAYVKGQSGDMTLWPYANLILRSLTSADTRPYSDDAMALGTASYRWTDVHSYDLYGATRVLTPQVTTESGNLELAPVGDLIINPTGKDALPAADNDIALGSASYRWTDVHGYDLYGATRILTPLITTESGSLELAPVGDVTMDPAGNNVVPETSYDINLGMLNKKYLTVHAAELWVETLVAQDTIATIGGRILVGPTTELTSDVGTSDTTIYVKHNQMSNGDRVYLEANGKVEFMAVTSGPSGSGPYSYTVTRNLDGTGANAWVAGDAVFNTGTAGSGHMDLYSLQSVSALRFEHIYVYDGAAYSGNLTDLSDFGLYDDGGVDNYLYLGMENTTWANAYFLVGTAGVAGAETWEFYHTSTGWTTLTATATPDFTATGQQALEFSVPAGWATTNVNGVTAYWVRADVTTAYTTNPRQQGRRVRGQKSQFGPTIVGNVRNSSTYNDWTEYWAIGNLNGLYGEGTVYGVGLGKYQDDWITIEPTNGIRMYSNNVKRVHLQTGGVLELGAQAEGEYIQIDATNGIRMWGGGTLTVELTNAGVLTLGYVTGGEYVQIDGTNGVRMYAGGTLHAQLSTAGVLTLGETAGGEYVQIDGTNGVRMWSGGVQRVDISPAGVVTLGATSEGEYMTLDATNGIGLYSSSNRHVHLTNAGLLVLGNTGDGEYMYIDAASGIRMYAGGTLYAQLTNAGVLNLGNQGGGEYISVQSDGIRGYGGGNVRLRLDNNGQFWAGEAYDGERIQWGSTNGLQIYNGSNAVVIQFDTSGNADITNKLRMPGTNSAIAIGTTPPTGPAAGTGIWIDRTGMYGLSGGTEQFVLYAADGKAKAGADKVILDVTGISITAPYSTFYQDDTTIKWMNGANKVARIAARRDSGASFNYMGIYVETETGRQSWLDLAASAPSGNDAIVQILGKGNGGSSGAGIQIEDGPTYGHRVSIIGPTGTTLRLIGGDLDMYDNTITDSTPYSAYIKKITSDQSISKQTWTQVTFNSTRYNNGCTIVSSSIRVDNAGYYMIQGGVNWANDQNGVRILRFRWYDNSASTAYFGGHAYTGASYGSLLVGTASSWGPIYMDANDTVQIQVYMDGPTTLSVKACSSLEDYTWLSVFRVA